MKGPAQPGPFASGNALQIVVPTKRPEGARAGIYRWAGHQAQPWAPVPFSGSHAGKVRAGLSQDGRGSAAFGRRELVYSTLRTRRHRPGDELQQQLAFQCLAEGGDAARLDREAAGAADHVAQVEVDDRPGAPAGGGVGKTAVDGADRLVVKSEERRVGKRGSDTVSSVWST